MKSNIFIVGCPGSGTTAMVRLLNKHPDIAIGMERFSHLIANNLLTPQHFEERRFFDVQPGDTWYDSLHQFKNDYDQIKKKKYKNLKFIGDNFPRGYLNIPYLGGVFQDARFIFCFSDAHEVANYFEERRRAGDAWPEDWGHEKALEFWNRSVLEAQRWIGYLPVLPVHYGDLLRKPQFVIERIARFLGLNARPLLAAARDLPPTSTSLSALSPEARATIAASANVSGLDAVLNDGANPIPLRAKTPHLGVGLEKTRVAIYNNVDRDIMDYQPWQAPRCRYVFTGPEPKAPPEESIVFLGSAATAGRFVEKPVAALVAERMGIPTINLGFGGARPSLYLGEPYVTELLQRCRLAVVEVMSARGYATSLFTPLNPWTNLGQKAAFLPHVDNFVGQEHSFVDEVYKTALSSCGYVDFARVLAEIRIQYLSDMKRIASLTRGRNLLFYFSQRKPDYHARPYGWLPWSGDFPHFVDANLLAVLRKSFAAYSETVSSTGLPQRLVNRHTGQPVPVYPPTEVPSANTYYPSPEMHREAAEAMLPLIEKQLAGR